jgi:hypothetical protein
MNLQRIRKVAFGLAIATPFAFTTASHSQDQWPFVIVYYMPRQAGQPDATAATIDNTEKFSFSISPGEGAMFGFGGSKFHFKAGNQAEDDRTIPMQWTWTYIVRITSVDGRARLEQVSCAQAAKDIGQISFVLPRNSSEKNLLPIPPGFLNCK